MKRLTPREEEIMELYWAHGALFVRELLEKFSEPRPHFNTISTIVRGLEDKGFLGHENFGKSHRYFAKITKNDFGSGTFKGIVEKYYNNSYIHAVSTLVKEEKLSDSEIDELIALIKNK